MYFCQHWLIFWIVYDSAFDVNDAEAGGPKYTMENRMGPGSGVDMTFAS